MSAENPAGFPPCPTPFNMAAHVLRRADEYPDKIALEIVGPARAERWSYARLKAATLGIGTGLLTAGLSPGDRVLMRLDNTVDFPLAYLGALAAGLVPIPTSSQLTAPEVEKIIATTEPGAILLSPGLACPESPVPVIPQDRLRRMRDLAPAAFRRGDPERPGYIIYTSGTSGTPRAVVHAHRAIWARQMMFEGWYGLTPQDRLMHAGAFNWTYTLGTGLMDPWTIGATALIPQAGLDPAQLPQLLKRYDVSLFAAAPGVYRKFLKEGMRLNLPRLRHGLAAGEKLSGTILNAWREATGTGIYEAFGMSECSTFISGSPTRPADPETLGYPQTGRNVAILGADGPVTPGAEGTIAIHRTDPGLMLGYLGAPDATREKFQGDWFLTGDQGMMDARGQITYLGRGDDMMNAGGYRVSPIEVENALAAHPGITQIGVTDIEVKQDVRLIMGFYTAPAPLDDAELAGFAARHLAAYKCPRRFVHVPTLPANPNGKLQRRRLAELL